MLTLGPFIRARTHLIFSDRAIRISHCASAFHFSNRFGHCASESFCDVMLVTKNRPRKIYGAFGINKHTLSQNRL